MDSNFKNLSGLKLAARVTRTLAGLSVLTLALPACADDAEVKMNEAHLSEIGHLHGMDSPSYVSQLMQLAQVYHRNGQKGRAETTFQKALDQTGRLKDGRYRQAEMRISWAGQLAAPYYSGRRYSHGQSLAAQSEIQRRQDLADAESQLRAAASTLDSLPESDKRRLSVHTQLESLLLLKGDSKGAERETSICMSLRRAATSGFQNSSAYQSAEARLLAAAAKYDRQMPANNTGRISAHQSLARFYQRYGKEAEFRSEQKLLSQLLGTNDLSVLLPPLPGCTTCGRG